jgi:hypothetical protein
MVSLNTFGKFAIFINLKHGGKIIGGKNCLKTQNIQKIISQELSKGTYREDKALHACNYWSKL